MTELSVGDAIFRIRTERAMTQEDLAIACGVHKNTIRRIENGHEPTLTVLGRISSGLGIDMWRLMKYSDQIAQRVVPNVVNP